MKQRLLLFGFIFLAFCSGSVLGFVVNSHMVREEWKAMRSDPDFMSNRVFQQISTELSLNELQQKTIEPIVKKHFRITEKIRQKSIPELKTEMDRYQKAVAKQLNSLQATKWDETCAWVRENCYGFKD